jgi:hypothetical protein
MHARPDKLDSGLRERSGKVNRQAAKNFGTSVNPPLFWRLIARFLSKEQVLADLYYE